MYVSIYQTTRKLCVLICSAFTLETLHLLVEIGIKLSVQEILFMKFFELL